MRAPSSTISALSRLANPSRPGWTCSTCRSQRLPRVKTTAARPGSARAYATGSASSSGHHHQSGRVPPGSSRGRVTLLAAATGAAATGVLAFTDDIKYSYEAVERAGRVAGGLTLCINE